VVLRDFNFLLSPAGQQLLSELAAVTINAQNHLHLATQLRQKVSANQAHALLETALLRQRAARKFTRADTMYFTREALEQATAEQVAAYRAKRFQAKGFNYVADLGCGIGGDAIALASQLQVIGVDRDRLRLAMAQENLRAYDHSDHFEALQADLIELGPLPVDALFADPGRRDKYGRRIYSVYDYDPPISVLERWRNTVPHQGIKISPGVNYAELPGEAEVEFISLKGEVREAVLWFGDLRSFANRRATLLPGGQTLIDSPGAKVPASYPKAFLYEPDGAVIRAHLVEQLARRLKAHKIDDTIAYLTAERAKDTPFARCFKVEDVFAFNLKRLRAYLRERHIGQVTIKKRGSPLDPATLLPQLRLQGEAHCYVFLTRVLAKPTVIIGQAV
jgi:SAM-dependent methyltransferase